MRTLPVPQHLRPRVRRIPKHRTFANVRQLAPKNLLCAQIEPQRARLLVQVRARPPPPLPQRHLRRRNQIPNHLVPPKRKQLPPLKTVRRNPNVGRLMLGTLHLPHPRPPQHVRQRQIHLNHQGVQPLRQPRRNIVQKRLLLVPTRAVRLQKNARPHLVRLQPVQLARAVLKPPFQRVVPAAQRRLEPLPHHNVRQPSKQLLYYVFPPKRRLQGAKPAPVQPHQLDKRRHAPLHV